MKILLVHQYFLEKGDGGGSRFNEMTKLWGEEGHEVSVISGVVNYVSGKENENAKGRYIYKQPQFYPNVDVFRCHVSKSYNASFIGRLWAYFTFVFSSIWAGVFSAKGKFDVLVVTSTPLFVGITAYIISRLKRVPLVFEIRDLWPESAIDTGVLNNKLAIKMAYWFEAFIYKRAKLINVLTPAFKEKLITTKNVPEEKIIYISNAADFTLAEALETTFDPVKFRKEQGTDDKFVITYVGAHGVANHLIQLVEAAEILQDTNVLIQFVGGGMMRDSLIEAAKAKGLTNVTFIPPVPKEEVFKYVLASDMGASVLKNVDTFKTIYSNKTFDYMSCKKPILLGIDGVSRQLIEEADCGIFVEPENIADIAAKIRRCINGEFDLKKQGENGYHHAKKYFDRHVLGHNYLKEMKKIAKNQG